MGQNGSTRLVHGLLTRTHVQIIGKPMFHRLRPVLIAAFALAMCTSMALAGERLEPPAIKDTAYAIPPGAVFVARTGNDNNLGTKKSPLRTISAAISTAADGGTIVIRRGIYREAPADLSKRLTLQPYPHEPVWLKGSQVITEWEADGNVWRKGNWTHEFCDDCFHPDNIEPEFPNAGQPDQVFVDGVPLKQVSRRKALTKGAFFVDDEADRLFIGTNPAGRLVEASVHGMALTIWQNGAGSAVRGLGFAHYAPVPTHGNGAMLKVSADRVTLENNTFSWSAAKGLEVFGRDVSVRGNTFVYNGWMGLSAWKANGLTVKGNRFAYNNREMFARSGHVSGAAGASITASRHVTVSDNLFHDNHAHGLWLDINVAHAVISRNISRNNLQHGVFYEISSNGIIASNIVTGNGGAGIALSDAAHMKVYNNTLVGNAIGFVVQDGDRVNGEKAEIAAGNSWVSGDTQFHNNLIAGNGASERAYIWVRDFTGTQDADTMLSASSTNGFHRRDRARPRNLVEWWRGSGRMLFSDLSTYRSQTGRGRDSLSIDGSPSDPFFTHAPSGNFALKPGSAARNRGRDLPPDVAKAIGVTPRGSPHLGALLLPGGRAVTPE